MSSMPMGGIDCVVLVLLPLQTCRFDNKFLKKSQHFIGDLSLQ